MDHIPNYKDKRKKTKKIADMPRFILAILLATSLTISTGIAIKKGIDKFSDVLDYNKDIKQYESLVNDSKARTNGLQEEMLDTFKLAFKIADLEINDKEDFYHHLIATAQHIHWNRSINMENLINDLDLDSLHSENPIYPSSADFREFLTSHNLLNEDGTINFEEWEKYDKEVFALEQELEETKEGKNL